MKMKKVLAMVRIEKNKKNKEGSKTKQILPVILFLFLFTGCTKYKSSWSCKNPEGIGCSSIGYADRIARKHIILNSSNTLESVGQNKYQNIKEKYKKLLINERYSDFKEESIKEVNLD